MPAREQLGVFFVEPDELDQVFDAKVGERLNTIFADAIDPDQAVLDFHFDGNVAQPIFVFTEVLCNLGYDGDVMNLVDVRGHAARERLLILAPNSRAAARPADELGGRRCGQGYP